MVLYVLVLPALRIHFWIKHTEVKNLWSHSEPLSKLLLSWFTHLSNLNGFLFGAGCIVSLLIATLISDIVNEHKLTSQKNYIAGLLFIVCGSLIPEFVFLSPQMIALLCVTRIIQKLFAIIKQDKPGGDIFDIGWLSSIAVLVYFPSVWLLLFSFIGLAIMRPFSLREWWMVLIGFAAPIFAVYTIYFWQDMAGLLLADITNLPHLAWGVWVGSPAAKASAIIILILFILAFLGLPRILFSSLIQVRKFALSLIIAAGLIILSFFFADELEHGPLHIAFITT
jgi:MFS family permease